MNNPCQNSCNINACICENSTKNDEKQLKIAEFKEKTDKIRHFLSKNVKNTSFSHKKDEKPLKAKNYHITIVDASNEDGYYMEYSKDINLVEFAMILTNIFGIDMHVGYDEDNDESLQEDVIFFKNLDEVIDFIQNRKKEEE